MYRPAQFDEPRTERLHDLVRRHPLGLLVTQDTASALSADPLPLLLDAEPESGGCAGSVLRGHVARANPLWREARTDLDSLVVFQGPQAYVSPSFYPSKQAHGKVVPTWNYLIVQARGRLRVIDDAGWLRGLLTRLTDRHEASRAAPWAVTDAPGDFTETLLEAIVGIEIAVSSLVGKWKVSQNRSAADRAGVVQGLEDAGETQAALLGGGTWPPVA